MIIYSLLSHSGIFLESHLRLLRENILETNKIIIVQGPYGKGLFSGGNIRLTIKQAKLLDIEILEAPNILNGHNTYIRQKMLIEWIKSQASIGDMIVHGDIFPIRKTTKEELLGGYQSSGRLLYGNILGSTWQIIGDDKHSVKLWGFEHPISKIHQQEIGLNIPNEMNVEWCDPCWLHINGMSIDSSEQIEQKRILFKDYLDNDFSYEVVDAQYIKPHIYTKEEIKQIKNGNFFTIGVKKNMSTTFPSFPQRVSNYLGSRKAWVAAGKPMRKPETIKFIYNTYCKPCEHYKSTGYACDICGCYINENNDWNKIAWATTKCPDIPPKWIEEDGLKGEVIIREEYNEIPPPEAIPPDPNDKKVNLDKKVVSSDPKVSSNPIPAVEIPPPPAVKPAGGCGCGH